MTNLSVIGSGEDDADRTGPGDGYDPEQRRLRSRYARHLAGLAAVDELRARRVVQALFDHRDETGRACPCSCHPRLSARHDDGLDCPCSWDDLRRAAEASRWDDWCSRPQARDYLEARQSEQRAIANWLAGQPEVEAAQTSSDGRQQWEGSVDGHAFRFWECDGHWQIDLGPRKIAEGLASQLGAELTDHLAFIVRTIRDHLWASQCDHAGALFYCPSCGTRVTGSI